MSILTPVFFVALYSPSFADAKPEELIVGKWENKQTVDDVEYTTVVEFTKDGKFNLEVQSPAYLKLSGNYKVLDANTLELEDKTDKIKGKFKVEEDTLRMFNDKGKATDYTRVK